jgi:hypothetical protein
MGREWIWLIAWVRALGALIFATRRTRRDSSCRRGLGRAVRGPTQCGAGRADRVERIGLARQAPRLTVRSFDLDDPDVVRVQDPRQASAAAAGPFDADEGDFTERGSHCSSWR